jgi:cellulose synthase/poly-beta-1,6-N-acetylglucosamine synthase-like glycosyltransferase
MLALDSHFVIEQTARNRAGWFINFSGSGGVWRTQAIRDAGGWSASTLTEDLDLSYRAQLAGWRFLYLPHVVVPAELPPQIAAYKQQQARWAQGSTQTLVHTVGPLWSAKIPFGKRIMATLHLCQYVPHPLMLVLLLLTPLLILTDTMKWLPLGPLGFIGLGPPLLYVVSQRALYRDWPQHLLAFPALLALGTGIAWNNTIAVVNGLRDQPMEFRRTPKFVKSWADSRYALKQDHTVWGEVFLAIYALAGMVIAIIHYPPLVPYLALYGVAFAFVAGWSLYDQWLLQHEPHD